MEKPDFSEWKQRQLWTLIEAACLLCAIEPMPAAEFDGNRKTGGEPAKIYADLKDAIDLNEIEFVETRDGLIRGRRVKPDECVTWAVGRGLIIPAELQDMVNRNASETPQQRRDRVTRRLAEEKAKGNRAYLRTVAEEEGVSPSRVKQIRDRANKAPAKERPVAANWADPLSSSSSKTNSPNRGRKN